jgi:hypothetical protein
MRRRLAPAIKLDKELDCREVESDFREPRFSEFASRLAGARQSDFH